MHTAVVSTSTAPGRSCPSSYRYRPEDLAAAPARAATTVYVIGGLYGNVAALEAVQARAAREDTPPTLVFNGDFHYLDVEEQPFGHVARSVAGHLAVRGNVESELADVSLGAGCGCGYPSYVTDETVTRSNAVMHRLRQVGRQCAAVIAPLAELPRYLVLDMAGVRVGVVHGDLQSLAGWQLALEALEPVDLEVRAQTRFRGTSTTEASVVDWLRRADVQVVACTHTGLPYAQAYELASRRGVIINNGSAGLPSFVGTRFGVLTRLSIEPSTPPDALYGTVVDGLRCDALPVRYDTEAWDRQFRCAWPPGSPAALAYASRLRDATALRLDQAARRGITLYG